MWNKHAFPKYLNLLLSIALIVFWFVMFFAWYSYAPAQAAAENSFRNIEEKGIISSYLRFAYNGAPMDELISDYYFTGNEALLREATQAFFEQTDDAPSWKLIVGDKSIRQGSPRGTIQSIDMPLLSSTSQTVEVRLQLP